MRQGSLFEAVNTPGLTPNLIARFNNSMSQNRSQSVLAGAGGIGHGKNAVSFKHDPYADDYLARQINQSQS